MSVLILSLFQLTDSLFYFDSSLKAFAISYSPKVFVFKVILVKTLEGILEYRFLVTSEIMPLDLVRLFRTLMEKLMDS